MRMNRGNMRSPRKELRVKGFQFFIEEKLPQVLIRETAGLGVEGYGEDAYGHFQPLSLRLWWRASGPSRCRPAPLPALMTLPPFCPAKAGTGSCPGQRTDLHTG